MPAHETRPSSEEGDLLDMGDPLAEGDLLDMDTPLAEGDLLDVDDPYEDEDFPPLLRVSDLAVGFSGGKRSTHPLTPLQGVNLSVEEGSAVALVGESGSGKSLTASAVMGMLPAGAEVLRGSVSFEGEEILGASEKHMRELRGSRLAIMFQNPRASLNPVLTVGGQIAEVIRVHEDVKRKESRERAVDLLEQMGIPNPGRRAKDYVHQYSGGMAQRAALAMALSCRPRLLIADEPTTGLDATLQQQVLELVVEQVSERQASLLLITHDIGIVGRTCEQMAVMYAGRVMESGPVEEVLGDPANPYTAELIKSYATVRHGRMNSIPGVVPTLRGPLVECAFADRCPKADEECREGVPALRELGGQRGSDERKVACVKA